MGVVERYRYTTGKSWTDVAQVCPVWSQIKLRCADNLWWCIPLKLILARDSAQNLLQYLVRTVFVLAELSPIRPQSRGVWCASERHRAAAETCTSRFSTDTARSICTSSRTPPSMQPNRRCSWERITESSSGTYRKRSALPRNFGFRKLWLISSFCQFDFVPEFTNCFAERNCVLRLKSRWLLLCAAQHKRHNTSICA